PQIAEQRFIRSKAYYDAFVNGELPMVNEDETKQPATGNWQPQTGNYSQSPADKLQTTNYKLQTSLVPHAPYSVSEELWNLIQPFFSNKTISIHNQETSFEDELFIQNGGDFLRMYQLMK